MEQGRTGYLTSAHVRAGEPESNEYTKFIKSTELRLVLVCTQWPNCCVLISCYISTNRFRAEADAGREVHPQHVTRDGPQPRHYRHRRAEVSNPPSAPRHYTIATPAQKRDLVMIMIRSSGVRGSTS